MLKQIENKVLYSEEDKVKHRMKLLIFSLLRTPVAPFKEPTIYNQFFLPTGG